MKALQDRLNEITAHIENHDIKIMILGLGSVGNYLLDYLASSGREDMTIILVGRNREKMEEDANIVRVSALIRKQAHSKIIIEGGVDFTDIEKMTECFEKYRPDFIVNSSRVYAGLKYGSISWKNVRAYGIWAPLAVKYIKNIMQAFDKADLSGIVINTSYSDAVIPWLKGAGHAYPDFGSGNMNHLIPRIQYAVSELRGIADYWNIKVMFATSHFHDVVISKEGQTDGLDQLIQVSYRSQMLPISQEEIFAKCKIPMPVDSKRNMMNASSNYEIIMSIIHALERKEQAHFFSPGVFGEIGGYPVCIDGTSRPALAVIDQSVFTLEAMRSKNRESIYFDGIENVENGVLVYTDELLEKVKDRFNVDLPKKVALDKSEETADLLIQEVIKKSLA